MADTMQNYTLVGDELLVALFSTFEKDKPLNFGDESMLMKALYKCSKKDVFKDLFANYRFDNDGIVPFSREVSDGLSILHQSSMMGKLNPTFRRYQLSRGVDVRFQKYIKPQLSDSQIGLIEQLGAQVKEYLQI